MRPNLFCRFTDWGTLHDLLLQSFDSWPSLKQLEHSQNFCTCSHRSIPTQDQIGCCPSLKGHSTFLSFVESSAFGAKVLIFSSSRLGNLCLSIDKFVCAHGLPLWGQATPWKQSFCLSVVYDLANTATAVLCCGEIFFAVELGPPDSRSNVYPSCVSAFTMFATTFENLKMLVESSCRTGRWACIFLKLAWTMTSDLPYFTQRISQAW